MTKALSILIHNSILSSLLILLVFILRFIFKDKINIKLQYAIWIIVAVRLLIPFNFQWVVESKTTIPQVNIIDFSLENHGEHYQSNYYHSSVDKSVESYISTSNSKSKHQLDTLYKGIFLIWIIGVISILAVFTMRNISFYKKSIKSMTPYIFSDSSYNEAAKIVGLKHRIPVYLSRSLSSPYLMGVFKPAIVLTDRVIHDSGATKLALIHEMIHYNQRDNLIRLLGNILCAFYWFNPLVWLAAEAARNDAELSCDSRVLEKISSREHYDYCLTLLSVAGNSNQMVAAMSTGGRKMKKRIDMIIKPPKNKTIAVLVTIICLSLGTASFIDIRAKAESSTAQSLTKNGMVESITEITSLGNIYEVYQLLTSLPNANNNYKINNITINNMDKFKSLDLGYEFSKSDSTGGLDEDDVRKINDNALRLFATIPDLNTINISYIDKQANSVIRNIKAPITYTYQRSQIKGENGDSITPQIDNSFWQSWGGNNVILIYGHSEILSRIGIEKNDYEESSAMVNRIFSILGDYDDTWQSYSSTIYRFSPNPAYRDWADFMIITDELGNLKSHGIILSDLEN